MQISYQRRLDERVGLFFLATELDTPLVYPLHQH